MNLVQLKSFVVVAKSGSFTNAAQILHLSQPAVSGHIRRLEDELGVALFERSHRHTNLTEAGRILRTYAEIVLKDMDQMLEKAREIARLPRRSMRLGFVVSTETVRMPALLNEIAQELPHVRMDVAQGLSGWVAAEVENGRLDAGFYMGMTPPPMFETLLVSRLRYLLCVPQTWIKEYPDPTPNDLVNLPWIWAPKGASYREIVCKIFGKTNPAPHQVIEADREATIAELLLSGLGAAVLREPLARASAATNKIVILENHSAEIPLFLLTRKDADADVLRLRDCVERVFEIP